MERASGLWAPDRKPKVAITTVYPMGKIGGVQSEVRDLAEDLPELGFDVTLYSPDNNLFKISHGDSMPLGKVIPMNVMGTSAYQGWPDFKSHKEVEEANIMHTNEAAIDFQQSFLLLKRQGLEYLQKRYGRSYQRKRANVGTLHAMNKDGSEYLMTFWPIAYAFDRMKIMNRMTVVSEVLKKRILKAFPFVRNIRIEVVPNGVDTRVFCPYPQGPKVAEFDDGILNILYVGRLEDRKGVAFALDAIASLARKYDNFRFIIAGSGPQREELERKVRDLGIGKFVKFLGRVSDKYKQDLMRTADIGLFLSTKNESFGIAPLEQEASGVPLVAGEIFKSVVEDGVGGSGYLVDPTDTRQVAASVGTLIEDKVLRAKMGKKAREIALRFDRKIVARMYADVYSDAFDDAQRV